MLIQSYIKKLLVVSLVVTGTVGFFAAGADFSHAQTLEEDPLQLGGSLESDVYYDPSDYQQWKDNFKETPVKEMAYKQNKKGCAQEMAFTTILIKKFKDGEGVESISESELLGPYMRDKFKDLREKGVVQVQREMMEDYRECIKTAKADKNPEKEYDLSKRYGACNTLNTILMGTIDGIKNRESMKTVLRRYKNKFPDLSRTTYSGMSKPSLFIAQLYQKAESTEWVSEQEKYDSLYEHASQLVVGCAL